MIVDRRAAGAATVHRVDRAPFAELNTHPLVVESLGSSPTRAESDAMVDRYAAEMAREGWGLWAVEVAGGAPFVGMVGLHRVQRRAALRAGRRGGLAAPPGPLGARLRHRGGARRRCATGSSAAGSTRSSPSPRRSTPARRRSWSASAWCATPTATSTTRACPRAARCGATCSTGSDARHSARAYAWRRDRERPDGRRAATGRSAPR